MYGWVSYLTGPSQGGLVEARELQLEELSYRYQPGQVVEA